MMLPMGAAEAQPPPPPPAAGWQTQSFTTGTPVMFSVTGPGDLLITDAFCAGDNIEVVIDGASVGNLTSPVAVAPGSTNCPPEVNVSSAQLACSDPNFASGTFSLTPGPHSIVLNITSNFVSGGLLYQVVPAGTASCGTGGAGAWISATAFCIESDAVQSNPNLQNNHGGDLFPLSPNHLGLISTGPPTCAYNCVDGFDLNCDGKLGDYCPTELDRNLVKNVVPCLEAAHPTLANAPASVPAVVQAPAAIAVAVKSELAHTGSETTPLAVLATASVGLGAALLGAAHNRRRD